MIRRGIKCICEPFRLITQWSERLWNWNQHEGRKLPRAQRVAPHVWQRATTATLGGAGGHEMWVDLIGWLCVQTSLRAMKWGVCCTKLLWIHVYTCTYRTHTHGCHRLWCLFPAVICCVLCVVGHKKYSFTGEHTPHVGIATIKHVVCPFSLRLMEFFLIWLQDDVCAFMMWQQG